jgi:hypothetical protein
MTRRDVSLSQYRGGIYSPRGMAGSHGRIEMNSVFYYFHLSSGRELTIGQHGFLCRPKGQNFPGNSYDSDLAI